MMMVRSTTGITPPNSASSIVDCRNAQHSSARLDRIEYDRIGTDGYIVSNATRSQDLAARSQNHIVADFRPHFTPELHVGVPCPQRDSLKHSHIAADLPCTDDTAHGMRKKNARAYLAARGYFQSKDYKIRISQKLRKER